MRVHLAEAEHPDEKAIERALPGVNRRFDGLAAAMKVGFDKMERRLDEMEKSGRRSDSEEGRATKRQRLEVGMKLAELAVRMVREGEGSGGGGSGASGVEVGDEVFDEGDDGDVGIGHEIKGRKPQSVREMYNEYFGLCEFVSVPVEGGLFGLEKRYGKAWRKHFSPSDSKFFSRMGQVVQAVDLLVDKRMEVEGAEKGATVSATIDEFDAMFVEKKRSLSTFVAKLQEENLLPKRSRISR